MLPFGLQQLAGLYGFRLRHGILVTLCTAPSAALPQPRSSSIASGADPRAYDRPSRDSNAPNVFRRQSFLANNATRLGRPLLVFVASVLWPRPPAVNRLVAGSNPARGASFLAFIAYRFEGWGYIGATGSISF